MRSLGLRPAEALHSVSLSGRQLRPYHVTPANRWMASAAVPRGVVAIEQAGPPLSAEGRDPLLQRVEAVLMLSREPLTSRKLAQLAQLDDGTQARTLVRKLNQLYDEGGRAFRVEEVASGYQVLTRKKFASWLRRLGHVPGEVRLSTPALETLAVVAYRQPVTKADTEAIRGVHCGEILRQLMERDLVRIHGRSEELGRPYLYATTKRFLQQFGLRSLDDLPRAEIVRSENLRNEAVPPVGKLLASAHHTSNSNDPTIEETEIPPRSIADKESDVSVTLSRELSYQEKYARSFGGALETTEFVPDVRLDDDDDDDFEDEEDDDLDDDEEEDEEDEFDDELDDEEEEDDDLDDDLDDEEWEEVEDDELEDDEDDEFEDDEEDDDLDDDEEDEDEDEDDDL